MRRRKFCKGNLRIELQSSFVSIFETTCITRD